MKEHSLTEVCQSMCDDFCDSYYYSNVNDLQEIHMFFVILLSKQCILFLHASAQCIETLCLRWCGMA